MSLRRRGGSALASSPDFEYPAPNRSTTSSYPGARSETAAARTIPDDASSDDPPYTPTTGEEDPEYSRIHEDDDIPARSPRRSKRLRPFYGTSKTVVRERLLLVQISSSSSSSDFSEEETEAGNNVNQSSKAAGGNFPAAPTTFASDNAAHESASVSACVSVPTPRAAHRRKQNRPFRCPVM